MDKYLYILLLMKRYNQSLIYCQINLVPFFIQNFSCAVLTKLHIYIQGSWSIIYKYDILGKILKGYFTNFLGIDVLIGRYCFLMVVKNIGDNHYIQRNPRYIWYQGIWIQCCSFNQNLRYLTQLFHSTTFFTTLRFSQVSKIHVHKSQLQNCSDSEEINLLYILCFII